MPVVVSNTPNPNALKFTVGEDVGGPLTYAAGSAPDNEVRLLTASFGDGYEQVAADGLNARRQVWRLRWQPSSSASME